MLIDDIKTLCGQCGLVDDPTKTTSQLEIKNLDSNFRWGESKFNPGDIGYSFCLTRNHMPEKYYDNGGNQIIYIDAHANSEKDMFIKGMWLYLPTITHSGHLRFMQHILKSEIYREDLILDGIQDYFIPFNESLESYIPEVQMDGGDAIVVDLVKKYLKNVRNVCRSLE